MTYISLTSSDLIAAALLIFINGAMSWTLQLGLERSIAIAAVRMVVQLGAIGFVLKFVFAQTSPLLTAAMAFVMILIAGQEVLARQETRIGGWLAYGLGSGTLLFVGLFATVYAMLALIQPQSWYAPRYVLPILGMVLGNAMDQRQSRSQHGDPDCQARAGRDRSSTRAGGDAAGCHAQRCCARGQNWADAGHEFYGGGWCSYAAGHDDRPDPRRRRAGRGGQVIRSSSCSCCRPALQSAS